MNEWHEWHEVKVKEGGEVTVYGKFKRYGDALEVFTRLKEIVKRGQIMRLYDVKVNKGIETYWEVLKHVGRRKRDNAGPVD